MHDDHAQQHAAEKANDLHEGMAPVDIAFVRPGARELYAQGQDDFLAPATSQSAGMDLRACLGAPEAVIPAGGRLKVSTGISVQPRLAERLRAVIKGRRASVVSSAAFRRGQERF